MLLSTERWAPLPEASSAPCRVSATFDDACLWASEVRFTWPTSVSGTVNVCTRAAGASGVADVGAAD